MRGSPSRVLLRIAPVALAVGAWLVVGASAAAASPQCGDTITQDTTLTSDVGPCSGTGLFIGADNITLDLNGHRVSGGISLGNLSQAPGRNGVTVRNGTIDGDVTLGRRNPPLPSRTVSDNLNTLTINGSIDAFFADQNVIAFNQVSGSIGLAASSNNEVAFNRAGRLTISGRETPDLPTGSTSNRAEHNQFGSVSLQTLGRDTIADNTVNSISVVPGGRGPAFDLVIGRNRVFGGGVALESVNRTIVFRNLVVSGPTSGISLTQDMPRVSCCADFPSDSNVLMGNRVVRSPADGIFIEGPHPYSPGDTRPEDQSFGVTRTLLRHNITQRNGDDGIHTDAPTTTLTKNIANFNADVGINAPAGAIDGGRNRAHGNGRAQCINIACSP